MKIPKSPLKWAILLGTTGITLYLCARVLRPFLDVIAWSIVLVITFHPVHKRVATYIKPRSLSALISTLLVALIILIPLLLITASAIGELADLKNLLQASYKDGFDPNGALPVGYAMEWLSRHFGLNPAKLSESLSQDAGDLTQIAVKYSLSLASNITNLVLSSVFTIFALFYLFRDGDRLVDLIPHLLPLETSQSEGLIRRIGEVIDGSIYGLLVIALIQGGLGGMAFGVLRIPSPVLWGLVMAVASLIPIFGAATVWIPGAIYLLLIGGWQRAIILAAFGGLVIGLVDNFLRPKLVGERVNLNELVMFFSVVGGLQLFGVLGIILGPVLFAITGSLIEVLRHAELTAASAPPPSAGKRD